MNDTELLREKIKTLKEKVKSLNILVVDDEEQLREKTGDFMEKFFNKVDCAEDGEIALNMYNRGISYDIVITDLQMPNMGGEELITKLRTIDTDLFIVVMTGTPDLDNDLLQQCDTCLSKPVGLDDMLKVMEALAEKKKL
jgi:CheY-like chemotaxis protein